MTPQRIRVNPLTNKPDLTPLPEPPRERVDVLLSLQIFIEAQYLISGQRSRDGVRIVSMPQTTQAIANNLGVSLGTIKNALAELARRGYILKRDSGLFLHLAEKPVDTKRAERGAKAQEASMARAASDDLDVRSGKRMSSDEVYAVLRDILRCSENPRLEGKLFVEAHRSWCRHNRLTPHL